MSITYGWMSKEVLHNFGGPEKKHLQCVVPPSASSRRTNTDDMPVWM